MLLQQVVADRQAEAGAAGGGAGLGLRERVEDLVELFGLDAGTGVADLEGQLLVVVAAIVERAPRPAR